MSAGMDDIWREAASQASRGGGLVELSHDTGYLTASRASTFGTDAAAPLMKLASSLEHAGTVKVLEERGGSRGRWD